MVTLTRRLQAIADMVPQGSTVVDVGTVPYILYKTVFVTAQ